MSETLRCWKCGALLDALLLPLARRAECPTCRAELHVCRMCAFFDPRVARACREPVADDVDDKGRANFCGYFQPGASRGRGESLSAANSRTELDALFGSARENPPTSPVQARTRLDDLFGK